MERRVDESQLFLVPDCLGQGTRAIEILFHKITELPQACRYVFDMAAVKFIEPCGVIALLSAVRYCASKSANRVLMINPNEHLYPYLERMNLFEIAGIWLEPLTPLDEAWSRNANTISLLELTPIKTYEDVTSALERARGIFKPWLSPNELFSLLRVVSELCQNIYQHSGDAHGCVLIQKYQSDQNKVSICLSVGDSGCGIRANLVKRYPWLGDDPVDFVRAAMDGNYTSRVTKRGGLGLRTVRDIAAAHRGLRVRSFGKRECNRLGQGRSGALRELVLHRGHPSKRKVAV